MPLKHPNLITEEVCKECEHKLSCIFNEKLPQLCRYGSGLEFYQELYKKD